MRVRLTLICSLTLAVWGLAACQGQRTDTSRADTDSVRADSVAAPGAQGARARALPGGARAAGVDTVVTQRPETTITARTDTLVVQRADTAYKPHTVDTVVTQRTDTSYVQRADTVVVAVAETSYVPRPDVDTVTVPPLPPPAALDSLAPDTALAGLAAFRDTASADAVELPRVRVAVNVPKVTRTVRVSTAAQLQSALDAAQPGDEILLANGVTFVGNFTLKPKSGWYRIRGAGATAPYGVRPDTTVPVSQHWPIVRSTSTSPALTTSGAASYAHLSTFVIENTATNGGNFRVGASAITTVAGLPHHITVDRMWIRNQGVDTKRCLEANGRDIAVVSSNLTGCKDVDQQVQGVALWNTDGRQRYWNNLIEGSGQNWLSGGADPKIPNARPCDIEIRGNYFLKPQEWHNLGVVATNFETKNGCRYLVAGNVFDGSWGDAQVGTLWNLKTANQSGACDWCESSHQSFLWNLAEHAPQAIQLQGCEHYVGGTCVATNHFRIEGNVFQNIQGTTSKTATIATVNTVRIVNNVWDYGTPGSGGGTWQHAFYCVAPSSKIVVSGNASDPASYWTKDCGTQSPGMVLTGNARATTSTASWSGGWNVATLAAAEAKAAVGVRAKVAALTAGVREGRAPR